MANISRIVLHVVVKLFIYIDLGQASTWSEWWTYEGISGPDFWGLVNPEWYVCTKGRRQSPINIDPKQLLFDPALKNIKIDKHKVSATLYNTGHDIRLALDEQSPHYINVTGGPLTYQYRITDIIFHFGITDSTGSEHTVNGMTFPAEIQILGYNSELYGNMTQAIHSTTGLTMFAILLQIGHKSNTELELIAQHMTTVKYKGQQVRLRHISVDSLLPVTDNYITYEGSLTQPGCQETVTWIVFNKPIYISSGNLGMFRDVMQGDANHPKQRMGNNYRPIVNTNLRPVRTNINFHSPTQTCTMDRQMFYQASVLENS